jgi:hypothetical protein
MPDRYGDSEDRAAAVIARANAVAHCELCDDDGYRGSSVCNHIDHASAAKRGKALVWRTMGWDRA